MQSYRGHCVRQRQNECSATNENDPNQTDKKWLKKKWQKIVQQQHKQREMVVPLRFHGQLKAKIAFCDCTYRRDGRWRDRRKL